MARYALLDFLFDTDRIPAGEYFELDLYSVPVRFTSGAVDDVQGTQVTFTQPGVSSVAGFANADKIEAALQAYLASAGRTDYTVSASFYPGDPNEPQPDQLGVAVTATALGAAYNFDPPVFSAGFPPRAVRANTPGQAGPTLSETVTEATCFGSLTASIVLTPAGGVPPYSYLWADGVTTKDRFGLAQGSYQVRVTDSDGPIAGDPTTVGAAPGVVEKTILVGQPARLELLVRKNGRQAEVVASGGTAPYTYLWDDGATTALRPELEPGSYSCQVRDANGCGAQIRVEIDPYRFYFSHDPIPLALDAGDGYRNDPTTKPDLSFLCEVFVERDYLSGSYVRVGQVMEQPADRDGRTTFEVQELLEPYVSEHLPELAAGQPALVRASALFCRFYLRWRERTSAGLSTSTTLDYSYLVHGGLSFEEAARGTWFSGYQQTVKPFLTWEPASKRVTAQQPEWLTYMVPAYGITSLRRRVQVSFTDGTTEVLTSPAVVGVDRYEVYQLACGFEALGLGRYAALGKRVARWQVFVIDQEGTRQSEVRTYQLDGRYQRTVRYFVYLNSLGGWNTLAAVGRAELQVAAKASRSERPRTAGYDPVAGDVVVNRRTGQPLLKVSAGARSAAQWLADQDFALSPRVLLYEQGRFRAGTVKDRSFTVLDEDLTRRLLSFDYELPQERHYTPFLPAIDQTQPIPEDEA